MHIETVQAYDAKAHFADLLRRVERGERIAITRHGVHIATLVPAAAESSAVDEAVNRLLARREHLSLEGLSIRELIEEGRR